jgi:hypothetical protein
MSGAKWISGQSFSAFNQPSFMVWRGDWNTCNLGNKKLFFLHWKEEEKQEIYIYILLQFGLYYLERISGHDSWRLMNLCTMIHNIDRISVQGYIAQCESLHQILWHWVYLFASFHGVFSRGITQTYEYRRKYFLKIIIVFTSKSWFQGGVMKKPDQKIAC